MQLASHTTMLLIIHAGTERGKRLRCSSPRGSHSLIAAIAPPLGKGGRKGSVSCGSPGGSSPGQARETNLYQHFVSQPRKRTATTHIVRE